MEKNIIYRGTRYVVAQGELTGHAHVITGPDILVWDVKAQRHILIGGAPGETVITHEEHGTQPIAPGEYVYIPQAEWNLASQWKKVVD